MENCIICLGDIKKGKYLACNHYFHKKCINKWLKNNNNCPMCRTIIIIKKEKKQIQQIQQVPLTQQINLNCIYKCIIIISIYFCCIMFLMLLLWGILNGFMNYNYINNNSTIS